MEDPSAVLEGSMKLNNMSERVYDKSDDTDV